MYKYIVNYINISSNNRCTYPKNYRLHRFERSFRTGKATFDAITAHATLGKVIK